MSKKEITPNSNNLLFGEIRGLIEQSRQQVAVTINSAITMLYWQIGKRINEEILQHKRAAYGKEIVATLSRQLTAEYGTGWSKRQLHHCLRFVEIFSDVVIVHTLCTQLSWSHIRLIISIEDTLKRDFTLK